MGGGGKNRWKRERNVYKRVKRCGRQMGVGIESAGNVLLKRGRERDMRSVQWLHDQHGMDVSVANLLLWDMIWSQERVRFNCSVMS